jgi:hypothetical protein
VSQLHRWQIRFFRFFSLAAAAITLMATLPLVAARADMLSPFGPRGPRTKPSPLMVVVGAKVMEKIHQAGFDCPALDDVIEKPRPGDDPGRYVEQHLTPLIVTCAGGKKYFVTLPYRSEDSGGAVVSLD